MGIEPTSLAWEAGILPMNYTRIDFFILSLLLSFCKVLSVQIMIFLAERADFFYNISGKACVESWAFAIRFWEKKRKEDAYEHQWHHEWCQSLVEHAE